MVYNVTEKVVYENIDKNIVVILDWKFNSSSVQGDDVLKDIAPYFTPKGASRRAELLMRIHGLNAYRVGQWELAQETKFGLDIKDNIQRVRELMFDKNDLEKYFKCALNYFSQIVVPLSLMIAFVRDK